MSAILFEYVAEQNQEGAVLDGVPLRDLTAEDLADLPRHVVHSVVAMPFYVRVGEAAEVAAFVPPAVVEAAQKPTRGRRAQKKDSAPEGVVDSEE
jgi:hypothetical protein